MKRRLFVGLTLLLSTTIIFTACSDNNIKKEESKDEVKIEEEIDEETPLLADDIDLNLGDKARIDASILRDSYGHDAEMLYRFNDFIGKEAPDITFSNVKNEEFKLSDYKGENLIIEFMGTWCQACISTTSTNDEFNSTYNDATLIGVSINDVNDDIKSMIKDNNVTNTDYFIGNEEVEKAYDVFFVPMYVFIDKEGYVQMIVPGDATTEQLINYSNLSFE